MCCLLEGEEIRLRPTNIPDCFFLYKGNELLRDEIDADADGHTESAEGHGPSDQHQNPVHEPQSYAETSKPDQHGVDTAEGDHAMISHGTDVPSDTASTTRPVEKAETPASETQTAAQPAGEIVGPSADAIDSATVSNALPSAVTATATSSGGEQSANDIGNPERRFPIFLLEANLSSLSIQLLPPTQETTHSFSKLQRLQTMDPRPRRMLRKKLPPRMLLPRNRNIYLNHLHRQLQTRCCQHPLGPHMEATRDRRITLLIRR